MARGGAVAPPFDPNRLRTSVFGSRSSGLDSGLGELVANGRLPGGVAILCGGSRREEGKIAYSLHCGVKPNCVNWSTSGQLRRP